MSEKVEEGVVLPMSERMAIDESIGGGEQPSEDKRSQKLRIGVVGNDLVSNAMGIAFDPVMVDVMRVDGLEQIDDLIDWHPGVTFLCNPVKVLENDSVDDADLINMVAKLIKGCGSGICIRSTLAIETVERLIKTLGYDVLLQKVVYNPVMTDGTDVGSILTPSIEYFGASDEVLSKHMDIMKGTSIMSVSQIRSGSIFEVAYAKLAINGFKAVKQTFFNQLHDTIMDCGGASPSNVRRLIETSEALTDRSVMVPTFVRAKADSGMTHKRARSFSGEFENDVRVLSSMTDKIPLLDECINYKNIVDKD